MAIDYLLNGVILQVVPLNPYICHRVVVSNVVFFQQPKLGDDFSLTLRAFFFKLG